MDDIAERETAGRVDPGVRGEGPQVPLRVHRIVSNREAQGIEVAARGEVGAEAHAVQAHAARGGFEARRLRRGHGRGSGGGQAEPGQVRGNTHSGGLVEPIVRTGNATPVPARVP